MADVVTEEFEKRKFAREMNDYMLRAHPELKHGNEWMQMVLIFHKMYGQVIRNSPTRLTEKEQELRVGLIFEEFKELLEANNAYLWEDSDSDTTVLRYRTGNPVDTAGVVDALGDLIYVIMGYFIFLGINPEDIMREIQLSNMSKLGADGKPIVRESDGKILKGPNYFKPDFSRFVRNMK